MNKDTRVCTNCKTEFEVEVYGTVYPGCKDREEIICPYCSAENGGIMTSQFVKTSKIK